MIAPFRQLCCTGFEVLTNPRPLPLRVTGANPATLRKDLLGRVVLEPRTHFLQRYRTLIEPATSVSKPRLTDKTRVPGHIFFPIEECLGDYALAEVEGHPLKRVRLLVINDSQLQNTSACFQGIS